MATSAFTLSSLARATASSSFSSAHAHNIPPIAPITPSSAAAASTVANNSRGQLHAAARINLSRRHVLSAACCSFTLSSLWAGSSATAAILEADDDQELLERVKKDRQKRIERQGVISSSNKETGYLQELVYKLSKVGQAIENNDFSAAVSVLGRSTDADWVRRINKAFTKLSSSTEEKTEVDIFNSSLASLISSVDKHDIDSSRLAFVSSASALEKWIGLTGLVAQLKGL